jgi:DedD protein
MAPSSDDAFREIQLSGKQLVFLFMAAVVILVVTFLAGVQVGRGVMAQRGPAEVTETSAAADAEPPPPPASASPDSTGTPVTANEKLSYAERLASAEPTRETLKRASPTDAPTPRPEAPAPASATASTVTAKPAPAASRPPANAEPAPSVTAAASTEPAGPGFAIQVAALRERGEADAIVKRLAGKGYSAYVVAPDTGAPVVYRVRVGKFKDRREADTIAARLQKEEQFKPWVVR